MPMSKKDYELIAAVFKRAIPKDINNVHDALKHAERFALVKALAFQFNLTQPRFNSGKFFEACGFPDPEGK